MAVQGAIVLRPGISMGGAITANIFALRSTFERLDTVGFLGPPVLNPPRGVATVTAPGSRQRSAAQAVLELVLAVTAPILADQKPLRADCTTRKRASRTSRSPRRRRPWRGIHCNDGRRSGDPNIQPIADALAPLVDLLGRLLTVIEGLSRRLDVLELEAVYDLGHRPQPPV